VEPRQPRRLSRVGVVDGDAGLVVQPPVVDARLEDAHAVVVTDHSHPREVHAERLAERLADGLLWGFVRADLAAERPIHSTLVGVDDLLDDLGDVRGVVVLMDRHARDAKAIADRYDVPIFVPSFVDPDIDAPTQPLGDTLPGTDFQVVRTVDWPIWDEAALYDGETLVVGDLVGTVEYFLADRERVGVHPMLRVAPPKALRRFTPERILTGHGEGVMRDGARALQEAADGARRRAPRVWLKGVTSFLS